MKKTFYVILFFSLFSKSSWAFSDCQRVGSTLSWITSSGYLSAIVQKARTSWDLLKEMKKTSEGRLILEKLRSNPNSSLEQFLSEDEIFWIQNQGFEGLIQDWSFAQYVDAQEERIRGWDNAKAGEVVLDVFFNLTKETGLCAFDLCTGMSPHGPNWEPQSQTGKWISSLSVLGVQEALNQIKTGALKTCHNVWLSTKIEEYVPASLQLALISAGAGSSLNAAIKSGISRAGGFSIALPSVKTLSSQGAVSAAIEFEPAFVVGLSASAGKTVAASTATVPVLVMNMSGYGFEGGGSWTGNRRRISRPLQKPAGKAKKTREFKPMEEKNLIRAQKLLEKFNQSIQRITNPRDKIVASQKISKLQKLRQEVSEIQWAKFQGEPFKTEIQRQLCQAEMQVYTEGFSNGMFASVKEVQLLGKRVTSSFGSSSPEYAEFLRISQKASVARALIKKRTVK